MLCQKSFNEIQEKYNNILEFVKQITAHHRDMLAGKTKTKFSDDLTTLYKILTFNAYFLLVKIGEL